MTKTDLYNLFLQENYILGANFLKDNIITPQNVFLYKPIISPGLSALYIYKLEDTKNHKYDLRTIKIQKFATKDSKKELYKFINDLEKEFDICCSVSSDIFRWIDPIK